MAAKCVEKIDGNSDSSCLADSKVSSNSSTSAGTPSLVLFSAGKILLIRVKAYLVFASKFDSKDSNILNWNRSTVISQR